jgi:O-acetyl-ADP-ribose deacetylase (regulator of RNase III)
MITIVIVAGTTIRLVRGDITQQDTDAIVNAANSSLMGGGGVDGAIHRAGGPAILDECRTIRQTQGPLPPGEAVITTGGRLKARYVIHTVGPVWRGGTANEDAVLANAYRASLRVAVEKGVRTIAFPSISTGAYGFPIDRASRIALDTIRNALAEGAALSEVRIVVFSRDDEAAYLPLFAQGQ